MTRGITPHKNLLSQAARQQGEQTSESGYSDIGVRRQAEKISKHKKI